MGVRRAGGKIRPGLSQRGQVAMVDAPSPPLLPGKLLWIAVLGVVARLAESALGRIGPCGDTHIALPASGPTSCPSHPHRRSLCWVLTPLRTSADEECVRVSEDSRSPPRVSDLASTQPSSGNAHSGSRATDGARGQRLAGGPPALPHQRLGPRHFRRICMDCSAANRPPGKHPCPCTPISPTC